MRIYNLTIDFHGNILRLLLKGRLECGLLSNRALVVVFDQNALALRV